MSQKEVKETIQHGDAPATPAEDLGELWQTLDVLPEAEHPEDLLATTIEMVAVDAGHRLQQLRSPGIVDQRHSGYGEN